MQKTKFNIKVDIYSVCYDNSLIQRPLKNFIMQHSHVLYNTPILNFEGDKNFVEAIKNGLRKYSGTLDDDYMNFDSQEEMTRFILTWE
jgi:hypothetical protein